MVLRNLFLFLIYLSSITIVSFLLNFGDFFIDFLYHFCNNNDDIEETFDYIIVGGGSAGSILANRLSSNKTRKILLLEAGKSGIDPIFHIPAFGVVLQNSPFNWNYVTVPQQHSCLALNNNASRWPMGKILGGTSMLNNMLYVRGHKHDFDEWFKNDIKYNYKNIMNYFKKVEEFDDAIENSSKSIYVGDTIFNTILPDVILKAANRLGYKIWKENLNCLIGFNKPKATLYKGKRWTSANILKSKKKSNLIIKTGRTVETVLLQANYEVYGVEYKYLGRKYKVYAKHGVILSAGVIGTPKILMLSGIGDKEHLEQVNIETKLNLPVGDNLQDHLTTGLDLIRLNRSLGMTLTNHYSLSSFWNYFSNGKGPWTTTGCDLMAFFNIQNQSVSIRPDLQFMVMPMSLNEDDGLYLRKLLGISDYVWMNYFEKIQKQSSISIMPIVLRPKSKGTVRLNRRNRFLQPEINPKYLTNQYDLDTLINGIKLIKQLIETPELLAFGAELNQQHFPGCEQYQFDTNEYWDCYVRHLTITSYHPVGTCKMGDPLDRETVVDFNFQVKQTNKLFIVDGSVLPFPISGNINGAILMIAEMASDLIQLKEFLLNGKCSNVEVFIPSVVCY